LSQFYLIAKIVSVFEKNGFLLIDVISDFPERFKSGLIVFIDVFGTKKKFIIEKVNFFRGKVFIKFQNFDNANDVEFLVGKRIFVEESQLVKLNNDTFYIHDLIGCKVFLNNAFFGMLTDVISLPANDVYVVKTETENEILIPAVKKFVEEIDIKNKIIKVSGSFKYEDEN